MADELRVPPGVLSAVTSALNDGRAGLEDTSGSSPQGVDAGEMTAMITGMLGKLCDSAGTLSQSLGAMSAQVDEAHAEFWRVDADQAAAYGGRERPGGP